MTYSEPKVTIDLTEYNELIKKASDPSRQYAEIDLKLVFDATKKYANGTQLYGPKKEITWEEFFIEFKIITKRL